MTTATICADTVCASAVAPRRARPHGLDRAIMRMSLAILLWARRRADRHDVPRDEQIRRYEAARDRQRREHAAALHVARLH